MAGMLAPLLGLDKVSMEDEFLLLGGHSLLGTQLIARVRDAFGIELTLRTLCDAPTVARLSAQVEMLLVAKLEAMSEAEAQRLLAASTTACTLGESNDSPSLNLPCPHRSEWLTEPPPPALP